MKVQPPQVPVLVADEGVITKPLRMPEKFVREMVADWMGGGRAITGKWEVADWYAANGHRMNLHPEVRARAENLIAQAGHKAAHL